jgi:hypothetical protein
MVSNKSLARRNKCTHVKYESLSTYQSKVITKVKVADGRTDRQMDGQTARLITIGHPP